MSKPTLKDLQSLLQPVLGDELTIENYEVKDLLPPGENYGSKIVSLRVTIREKNQATRDLDLVAKLPTPTRVHREMYDSTKTFQKEIFMYSKLLPSYRKMEMDKGIEDSDIAPKYYGSKLEVHPIDDFHDDTAILIENLKPKGYYCTDRRYGCDLAHAKLTVKAMARFHSLGMATKEKNPEFFETLKVQSKWVELANADEWTPIIAERLQDIAKDPEINEHFEACAEVLKKGNYESWLATPTEPWSTIIHADFWANNMMYHKGSDGQVDDVKLIDFQNYLYLSPLRELTFFLTSGLHSEALGHLDELIDLYYDTLIEKLKALDCDVEPYSRESFNERIREDAQTEFSHSLSMIKILSLDINPGQSDCNNIMQLIQNGENNEAYCKKLRDLVGIYSKKMWL